MPLAAAAVACPLAAAAGAAGRLLLCSHGAQTPRSDARADTAAARAVLVFRRRRTILIEARTETKETTAMETATRRDTRAMCNGSCTIYILSTRAEAPRLAESYADV